MNKSLIFPLFIFMLFPAISSATPCGEFVYNKKGWFGKYHYLPNTALENTKKNGVASSTIRPSTEQTTASVDPGVSTGAITGTTQSFSSFGECSFWKALKDAGKSSIRKEYLDQNLAEFRKQAALGEGGHLVSLAVMSNCPQSSGDRIGVLMQENYSTIGIQEPGQVVDQIDQWIRSDSELHSVCLGV